MPLWQWCNNFNDFSAFYVWHGIRFGSYALLLRWALSICVYNFIHILKLEFSTKHKMFPHIPPHLHILFNKYIILTCPLGLHCLWQTHLHFYAHFSRSLNLINRTLLCGRGRPNDAPVLSVRRHGKHGVTHGIHRWVIATLKAHINRRPIYINRYTLLVLLIVRPSGMRSLTWCAIATLVLSLFHNSGFFLPSRMMSIPTASPMRDTFRPPPHHMHDATLNYRSARRLIVAHTFVRDHTWPASQGGRLSAGATRSHRN